MAERRHMIDTAHLSGKWVVDTLFPICERLRNGEDVRQPMRGRALYCLFYEPSFMTRASFERAAHLLGGQAYHTEDASRFFPAHSARFVDDVTRILASMGIDAAVVRSADPRMMARAAAANALSVINGGSPDDHPTQALADLYTIHRERGGVDGATVAVIGRLEHRNVSALLKGLAMFEGVEAVLVPFSGVPSAELAEYCAERGVKMRTVEDVADAAADADAVYLNGPRTAAHMQILRNRGRGRLAIDSAFMDALKPDCFVMDPMQRSGDFSVETEDPRIAFYRQAENALYARMGVLADMFG